MKNAVMGFFGSAAFSSLAIFLASRSAAFCSFSSSFLRRSSVLVNFSASFSRFSCVGMREPDVCASAHNVGA
eukprot:scaffold38142_cov27-Tisochrysis_lutea.AAC.3